MLILYFKRYMSFNVHQLRHLGTCVLLWGPIWSFSTFPFEDSNGYLIRIKHGPNKVDVELFNTMIIKCVSDSKIYARHISYVNPLGHTNYMY